MNSRSTCPFTLSRCYLGARPENHDLVLGVKLPVLIGVSHMVLPTTYSIAMPAYYAALCLVAIMASRFGGRYERSAIFVLIAGSLATLLAQCVSRRYVPLTLFTGIDVLMAVGFLRILIRHRRSWIAGTLLVQCVAIGVDVLQRLHVEASELAYLNGGNLINYAIMIMLAYGCLYRRFGPPHPLPKHVTANPQPNVTGLSRRL